MTWIAFLDGEKQLISCRHLPSSQTSVSILTARALLWRCCKFCPLGLQQFGCCLSVKLCAPKNGTIRAWSPIKPGVDSTPSSKSISDEDSESDAFFKCWPKKRFVSDCLRAEESTEITDPTFLVDMGS